MEQVAAYSGLRQGELLALRWGCVDFVGGLLHVRRNYTDGTEKVPKGKKVRSVPMTPDVIDALGKLKERGYLTNENDLVFCSPTGAHLDHFNLRRHFYAAIKKAGLRRIRFHDLRHHFGSMAITAIDPYAVQSYMGHHHYSTTQRYLHHKPRPEDAARLHAAFGGNAVPAEPRRRAQTLAEDQVTELSQHLSALNGKPVVIEVDTSGLIVRPGSEDDVHRAGPIGKVVVNLKEVTLTLDEDQVRQVLAGERAKFVVQLEGTNLTFTLWRRSER